ncbi:hypothetical protein SAMN06297251_1437 [Fulvimarina manganoxydans]|uniref:Extracellular solute-binding protein, family 3 n=1 Tax=Fulvimarina manganoxydans TaxID=937218 RepID=A0A1W2EYB9_9HYPH|nr:amino acid ABC transporter substrate-binding protein [Fulvimarina manganoxydans]SMD14699.1 hypothetical protein SAMN06297251_1437 [Fulvimarina manganoxydans]
MRRRTFMACGASMLAMPWVPRAFAGDDIPVFYNATEKIDDSSLSAKALRLAVSKIDKPYVLKPSPVGYPTQSGVMNALATGGDLDICWVGVDKTVWNAALPVPFPIDGGLLGYRLFLINGQRQREFSSVKSLDDLRRYIAIQGPGWGDIDILRNAGITVRTGLYKNLFRMTVGGRADFFPRAAFEAINEQTQHVAAAPGLAVEESLILKYQFTLMFFVSKKKPELRDDLLKGLMAAHADGSYEAMFKTDANVETALSKGHLGRRKLIEIDNPMLPSNVNSIDRRLWLSL